MKVFIHNGSILYEVRGTSYIATPIVSPTSLHYKEISTRLIRGNMMVMPHLVPNTSIRVRKRHNTMQLIWR